MASIFQVFDLNEALAGAKQPRRHVVGGFEAPRNSLDVGSNFEATDVSTSASSSKPEDIPFGYEYCNPALAASGGRWKRDGPSRSVAVRDRLEQSETKRRAPNVVARLMGLDALPDELPTVRPRKSLQEMPTYGFAKPEGGNPVLTRQHSQGVVPSSWQRPPLPRSTVQRVEEARASAPVLPFRDHPQEEQLQKFKKEFEAKQQERLRASQLEEMNRHLEEKKNKVRATLDKAKIALSQGIIAEPKRLNGQGKFEESKEFLDAMEFLQCNKDFIFQFLQQKPHVVFSNENSNATTPVTHVKPLKKGKGGAASPRDSTERRREGFSPRAIARLFMPSDSRKRSNDHNKQQSATSSGSQPAIERCNSAGSRRVSTESRDLSEDVKPRTSTSTNSRYMLPPASPKVKLSKDEARGNTKNGARDVIVEIKERLRRRDQNSSSGEKVRYSKDLVIRKEHLQGSLRDSKEIAREIAKNARETGSRKSSKFTLTKSLSTGKRISMMRPDMDDMACTSDGEDISTPSVKIVRENVTRSCISLPSSPRLSARSHEAAASPKITRKRATENTKPLLTDPTDTPATLRAAERAMATKKACLMSSESPRRGSPRSSAEGEKRMRRSASVNENTTRSNTLKQKTDSPVSTGKRLLDPVNEPASNLTRSRSVPNVALLRERGQCTTETARTLGSGTAKTIREPAKPAKGQSGDKRKLGFFSVGRKKGRDGHVPEATMPSSQQALFPSPSPVLSRVAALAEACVSQSNTLSDADSAVNVRIHVRSSRNGSKKGKENPRAVVACAEADKAHRESPSLHESVVPESSADSDAAPCENEFLEVLSQMTPLAKRKPTTKSPRTAASALPSTACPPSPNTQQVQNDKKISKPPRGWKTARNILGNVDDGQESNSDKNGQPSPVSVLEPPFEEESLSPLELKVTNDLQELRIRLRLLKVDGSERARDELENVPEMLIQRAEVAHQSLSRTSSTNLLLHKPTNTEKFHLPLENLIPPCSAGPEADFAFMRDILVTSGFHTHGGRNITRWHSSSQPISHQIFKKVEASYSASRLGASHRRILFDAINEILVAQLEPQCYEQPWLQITNRTASKAYVATGRRLVEEVWSEIRKRQFPARCRQFHNDYLESLVAQDLQTSSSWLSLHREADRICLQLEKVIWNDLVEELCGGL